MDSRLTGWDGAFVTPVHVGHPDFPNRGGQFLYLWDEKNLYIGMRCLDQKPAHIGTDNQIWNGDAVEFVSGHPAWQVRDLPAFRDCKLQGAEVTAARTTWGYTAEFKLPWANFPKFTVKMGEIIGIDCELCSSDSGPRVDRTSRTENVLHDNSSVK